MKKRYVLKNKSRFLTIITAVIILFTTILVTSTVYGSREVSYKTIVVKYGDTLWDIAKKYDKDGDIRKYIYKIKTINRIEDGKINAGEELKIAFED